MRPRPDVWAVGLVMVDGLYVEGEQRTLGLLAVELPTHASEPPTRGPARDSSPVRAPASVQKLLPTPTSYPLAPPSCPAPWRANA